MKKGMALLLGTLVLVVCASCAQKADESEILIEPDIAQMKALCELATEECHYHSVVDCEDTGTLTNDGLLKNIGFISEIASWDDKHFWMEYDGIIEMGIDMSNIDITVDQSMVTIAMPDAIVLSCRVDSDSLTKESYVVEKSLAKLEAEDEKEAIAKAQEELKQRAQNDSMLRERTTKRAKQLLENYIIGLSEITGKEYTIKWEKVDSAISPATSESVE